MTNDGQCCMILQGDLRHAAIPLSLTWTRLVQMAADMMLLTLQGI